MKGNVFLVIKTDDRMSYPLKKRKEKKVFDSSFSTLLNGFMNNQVNQTCVEKKGTVKSVKAFGVPVTRVAKREESKEEEIVKGEERKKDIVQLSWQKRTFKISKKVMDRNNSSKNPEITKLMQTEKFPENLVKRGLKLKAGKLYQYQFKIPPSQGGHMGFKVHRYRNPPNLLYQRGNSISVSV